MKNISAGLAEHLASGTTTLCWCWRITRKDGQVFGFTSHDETISFASTDFEPEAGFTASEIRAGSELNVDAQDAQGVLSSDRITEADIVGGLYDAADVEIWRVNWQDSSERVLLRRGVIGEIRRGRVAFTAEMRSLAHVLDQSTGRTYQYACDAALGDGRCKVNLASVTYSGTIWQVLRDRTFVAGGIFALADGYFTNGVLTWTSGGNAGRKSEVMIHAKDTALVTLTLLEPPPFPMHSADAFSIVAGCDKQSETCQAKFANIANFRGFPHIPGQDTILRYAKQSKLNDGSVL